MFRKTLLTMALLALGAGAASAETYEVRMLNKGAEGAMVFEPAFVRAAPGDTIRFVSVDKGHNAQGIKGMLPEGVEAFKSKMSVDFDLVVETEGLYGVKCTPHIGMGMVALIQVGAAGNLDEVKAVKLKGKAAERMESALALVE